MEHVPSCVSVSAFVARRRRFDAPADRADGQAQRPSDDTNDGGLPDSDASDDAPSDQDPIHRLAPVRNAVPPAGGDLDAEDRLRMTAQPAILTGDMQARLRAECDGSEPDDG